MTRKTPAGFRAATWPLLLGVIALTFLLKACAEQPPTETTAVTKAPQLAAGGAVTCTDTPCIAVKVVEKGNNPPKDAFGNTVPLVVTVVHGVAGGTGSLGPQDITGTILKKSIGPDGVAYFNKSDFNLALGGYCAWVGPIADEGVATADSTLLVPTSIAGGIPAGAAAPFAGAVSDTESRSVTLTVPNYEDNCLWFYSGSAAPGVLVDNASALSFILKVNPPSTLALFVNELNGSNVNNFPAWALGDLTEETLDGEIDVAATKAKIPWADLGNLNAGVRVGFLGSAGFGNSAIIEGLTDGEPYDLEAAVAALTLSLKAKEGAAKGKKGNNPPNVVEGDADPLACVVNSTPDEPLGDVDPGQVDFLTVYNGYRGKDALALGEATFIALETRADVWYNQIQPSSSFQVVTWHSRLKRNDQANPPFPADLGPETVSLVQAVDFAACRTGGQPVPAYFQRTFGDGNVVRVDVACRKPLLFLDPDEIRVTWSIQFPASRLVEFRFQVNGDGMTSVDSYPSEPRNEEFPEIRSMVQIPYPLGPDLVIGGGDDCPLADGTIKSNDPKWDITG